MWGWGYGSRWDMPWRWREPTYSPKRCPKCRARLVVTPVEDRCPYCGYSLHKQLSPAEHDSSILPSLKSQIEEAIEEAENPRIAYGPKFISLELPRALNVERWLLSGLSFGFFLVFSESHSGGAWDDYILTMLILPTAFLLFSMFTTFLMLKRLSVAVGALLGLTGLAVLLWPESLGGLPLGNDFWDMDYIVLGYQIISGFWFASIAWRDYRLLVAGRDE